VKNFYVNRAFFFLGPRHARVRMSLFLSTFLVPYCKNKCVAKNYSTVAIFCSEIPVSKTTNPIRRLVLLLEEARQDFDRIAKKFDRSNDWTLANEEMDLWEERICEELTELGAGEAAKKIRAAKWMIIAGEFEENMDRRIEVKESVLVSLLNDVTTHPEFWKKRMQSEGRLSAGENEREVTSDVLSLVTLICSKFHIVALQLRERYNERSTLEIEDEYDVQDLLHSLLRLHFDDIRPEEWTPSYAGGSARMDFLLKAEQIVIEAKMARPGRNAKRVFDELIVDAARYKEHPGCKTLVCFVYDPERVIKNPRGVENDLRKISDSRLQVVAVIAP
jgi:DpnII restriction endonuclease